ncbi:aminodeoxychorismate lyase [Gallaecimonas pentaromativorans]|uniref:aminodeoxychorismate lyase n=1 Tax=Gallaecimonas pentaromativorans TaxID=584787 RepID=UPI003A8E4581
MLSLEPYPSRLQYGDGHFTTVRVSAGLPVNWQAHQYRLDEACARLAMAPIDWQALTPAVMAEAKLQGQGGLKILVARAPGGRGYKPGPGENHIWLSRFAEPAHYPQWRQAGISLAQLPITLGSSPLLAGLKHCNRLEQVLAAQALSELNCDDGILLDESGHVVSAISANVFWFNDGKLHTPSLDKAGVQGTLRAQIINSTPVLVGCWGIDALLAADEVFITNALMGIVPVRRLEQRHFGDFSQTRSLINNLQL